MQARGSLRPRLAKRYSSHGWATPALCILVTSLLLLYSLLLLHARLSSAPQVQLLSTSRDQTSIDSESPPNPNFESDFEINGEKSERNSSAVNGEGDSGLEDEDLGVEDRRDPSDEMEDFDGFGDENNDRIDESDDGGDDEGDPGLDGVNAKNSSDSERINDKTSIHSDGINGDNMQGIEGVNYGKSMKLGGFDENLDERIGFNEIAKGSLRTDRKGNSGYVWDHVMGVSRRAFTKTPSDEEIDGLLNQWDDSLGLDLGLNLDDKSKMAFSSDDQPVDDTVRSKMQEINKVEDALLLKTSGGSSTLRDGWAPWFESIQKRSSKGDFMKRDRAVRSTLEVLNPMNNPLLQDPDSPGVTGLTKSDKLIQKAMRSKLEKTPFGVEKTPEVKSFENQAGRFQMSEAQKVRRKPLNNSVGNTTEMNGENNAESFRHLSLSKKGENSTDDIIIKKRGMVDTDMLNYEKNESRESNTVITNVESQGKQEIKTLEHSHHVNGRIWGYYPGLEPSLSYSDFMDRFFRYGKCSLQVFMVWNSPPWSYTVRYQRGLESLLHLHPDACVVMFSETMELDFFKDFVKDGYKIAVVMPNLDELLKDTPTRVFAYVWHEWKKVPLYHIHYSELLRLAALYKYGGIYLDSDVVVLKPLHSLNNSVGVEDQPNGGVSLNGAVMAFKRHSPFIMKCLKEFYSTYDDTSVRWNGAELITRVAGRFIGERNNNELKTVSPVRFFPLSPANITRYFRAASDEAEKGEQESLFQRIIDESIAFHFWNSFTSSLVPEPGSLVERLINYHCLHCLDIL
ncbi:hypothetical protein AMTRI_Chr02g255830 [Amborella trichopoda]